MRARGLFWQRNAESATRTSRPWRQTWTASGCSARGACRWICDTALRDRDACRPAPPDTLSSAGRSNRSGRLRSSSVLAQAAQLVAGQALRGASILCAPPSRCCRHALRSRQRVCIGYAFRRCRRCRTEPPCRRAEGLATASWATNLHDSAKQGCRWPRKGPRVPGPVTRRCAPPTLPCRYANASCSRLSQAKNCLGRVLRCQNAQSYASTKTSRKRSRPRRTHMRDA